MGSAKPTLGYSSRTDAVVALRAQGVSPGVIAERIGITPKQVYLLEYDRRRGHDRPAISAPAASRNALLQLFPLHQTDLRQHAARRGISVQRLVQVIVETVLEERIVDAVLDDADDLARWS